YTQKILVAVEFSDEPRRFPTPLPAHSVFQRIKLGEVTHSFAETHGLAARLFGAAQFRRVPQQHMSYCEDRTPAAKTSLSPHPLRPAPGPTTPPPPPRDSGAPPLRRFSHLEPPPSGAPSASPSGAAPSHFHLGEQRTFGQSSVFWFNFFPAQPYLFEKTFA